MMINLCFEKASLCIREANFLAVICNAQSLPPLCKGRLIFCNLYYPPLSKRRPLTPTPASLVKGRARIPPLSSLVKGRGTTKWWRDSQQVPIFIEKLPIE
jgi:hypothetical protein